MSWQGVVPSRPRVGRTAVDVTGVTQDSRKVKPGDLFVAVPGTKEDGAQFVGEAVQPRRGGGGGRRSRSASQVPFFKVSNARKALALIAANFYGRPARAAHAAGRSPAPTARRPPPTCCEAMATAAYASTGVIGTLGYKRLGGQFTPHDAAHHAGPAGAAPHPPRDGGRGHRDGGDGGVQPRAGAGAGARPHLQRGRLHQPDARPPRLPQGPGGVLPGQAQALRGEPAPRAAWRWSTATTPTASRIYNELRGQKRMAWKFSRQGTGRSPSRTLTFTPAGHQGRAEDARG